MMEGIDMPQVAEVVEYTHANKVSPFLEPVLELSAALLTHYKTPEGAHAAVAGGLHPDSLSCPFCCVRHVGQNGYHSRKDPIRDAEHLIASALEACCSYMHDCKKG